MSGYPIEHEDREFIASLPNESNVLALRGTFNEVRLDPRQVIQVENQSRLGSCAGHSLSSVLEWVYAIGTNGEKIQLSRAMAYFATQEIDGIRGDSGSTVGGGVKLATTTGVCEERLWLYPSKYSPQWPTDKAAVKENAAKYKVQNVTKITSYDGFRTFLGAGLGGIHTGIGWGNAMNRAVVESYSAGGGGHSICGLCMSERVDSQGMPYAWILNSWSETFGNKGWQEWSPTAIRQMLSHRFTVMIGLSDMPNLKPRSFTLADLKTSLRI